MAAFSIARYLGADDLPAVTVTHATGVFVISKLSAIRIFFTMKHAAITGHAALSPDWVVTVGQWTALPLTLDRALTANTLCTWV